MLYSQVLRDKIFKEFSQDILPSQKNQRLKKIFDYSLEVAFSLIWLVWAKNIFNRDGKNQNDKLRKAKIEYARGNFYLRFYLYEQRLIQFLNAVFLEITPENRDLKREILKNDKLLGIREVLNNFYKNDLVKKAFKIRRTFTHNKFDMYPYDIEAIIKSYNNKDFLIELEKFFNKFTINESEKMQKIINRAIKTFERVCRYLIENYDKEILQKIK